MDGRDGSPRRRLHLFLRTGTARDGARALHASVGQSRCAVPLAARPFPNISCMQAPMDFCFTHFLPALAQPHIMKSHLPLLRGTQAHRTPAIHSARPSRYLQNTGPRASGAATATNITPASCRPHLGVLEWSPIYLCSRIASLPS